LHDAIKGFLEKGSGTLTKHDYALQSMHRQAREKDNKRLKMGYEIETKIASRTSRKF
jgi:hypothetical protein